MAHCVRIKWFSCCPLELFHFRPFPQQKKKTACCGEVNTSSSWNLLKASSRNLVRSGRNLCGAKICKDKVHWCFADSCLLLIVSGGCHGARSFYWNLATVRQSLPSHEMELRESQASVVEFLLLTDCVLFDCRVPVFRKRIASTILQGWHVWPGFEFPFHPTICDRTFVGCASEDEMFQRLMERMRSAELEGIDVVEKLWSSTYRSSDQFLFKF